MEKERLKTITAQESKGQITGSFKLFFAFFAFLIFNFSFI